MQIFEFWVSLSTHEALRRGEVDVQWRKYLVAEVNWWEAQKTAIAMAWRENKRDWQVTECIRP